MTLEFYFIFVHSAFILMFVDMIAQSYQYGLQVLTITIFHFTAQI